MRASVLFVLTACVPTVAAALIGGCDNQPQQQVTGLPSTPPLRSTPAPTAPLFGYAITDGQGPAHAGAGIIVYTIDRAKGTLKQAQSVTTSPIARPSGIAIEPTRKFAYVVSRGDARIRVYTVDQKTGALSLEAKAAFDAGTAPVAIAIAPSGTSLYVADAKSGGAARIYQFALDTSNGSVEPMQPASVSVPVDPAVMSMDPSGRFAYVVDRTASVVQSFTIDSVTGALKAVGKPVAVGDSPWQIVFDATSKYAYVVSNAGVSPFLMGDDGRLKSSGAAIAADKAPFDLDFDPSGSTAYITSAKGISTYTFNLANGALTYVQTLATAAGATPTCTTAGGSFIYLTATDARSGASSIAGYAVDEYSGKLKAVPHVGAAAGYGAHCLIVANTQ